MEMKKKSLLWIKSETEIKLHFHFVLIERLEMEL